MSRYDRQHFAGKFVAQEARKSARSGDHAFSQSDGRSRFQSGVVVDTKASGDVRASRREAPETLGIGRPQDTQTGRPDKRGSTSTPGAPMRKHDRAISASPAIAAQPGTLTLPWPPTGNNAYDNVGNRRITRPHVIAYRDAVALLCARFRPVRGRYRMHVHFSPPDARARDMDNALKSINDALVKAGYLESDSMTHMRELLVTTDDERRGNAIVRAIPL